LEPRPSNSLRSAATPSNHDRAAEVARDAPGSKEVQADVRSEADVLRLFEEATGMGPLSALVNNAGTLEAQMRLDAMDAGRFDRVYSTNVRGTFI
jgi:NAD(P)-dependent dehydrogenase (short-subunit alcohol dehydrogenase family)